MFGWKPEVPQLVIAGGPGSGKDKVIARILATYPGAFHVLGETAGMFIRAHALEPPFLGEDLSVWQKAIAAAQHAAEEMGQIMARRKNALVLCNRGRPDGAGYIDGGIDHFLTFVGGTLSDHLDPYDMVIFLDTPDEEIYVSTTAPGADGYNPDRFETHEQAVHRALRLKAIWTLHPDCRVVPAMPTIERKFEGVAGHIDEFLRRHGRN